MKNRKDTNVDPFKGLVINALHLLFTYAPELLSNTAPMIGAVGNALYS